MRMRAFLTLLALVAVACAVSCARGVGVSDAQMVRLSENAEYSDRAGVSDYAYVRGGQYADLNWREMDASKLVLKATKSDPTYVRRVVLKFDASDIDLDRVGSVYLDIKPTETLDDSIHFNVYLLDGDWSGESVTWNSVLALSSEKIADNAVLYGDKMTDLSIGILDAAARGDGNISLLVERVETMANETHIPVSSDPSLMPELIFFSSVDPITAEQLKNRKSETVAVDYAYIRGGKYADTNWRDINAELGINELRIKSSVSDEGIARYLLLKFDLSRLPLDGAVSASLDLRLYTQFDKTNETHYDVYLIDNDWSGDRVTWNSVPDGERMREDFVFSLLTKTDIGDVVIEQYKRGERYLSLMIVRHETVQNESAIRLDDLPVLRVYDEKMPSYTKALSSDETKNAEYWSNAEAIYADWLKTYEELSTLEDAEIDTIDEYDEEFCFEVKAKPQNTEQYSLEVYKTRTIDSLKNFSGYTVEYDAYGGIKDESLRAEATGFFYTKKIEGRWWIIDPLGYPYYVSGVDVVKHAFAGSISQKNAVIEQFGSVEKWAVATTRQLREDLYFNTASRPDREITLVASSLSVQYHTLEFLKNYASEIGLLGSGGGSTGFSQNNTMPVFDPDFTDFCDRRASEIAADEGNRYVLGYTFDNELPMDDNMLDRYLGLDYTNEANFYSYAAAWTWLVNMTGKESPDSSDVTDELRDAFRGFVYDRYYRVTSEAFRKYDQSHLILGTRSLTPIKDSEWVSRVSGKYCDIITVNWYGQWTPDATDLCELSAWSGKPIMITEFYVKAGDAEGGLANTSGAGWFVETQLDRADFYHNFTLRLLECRSVVGWYWLQYGDNDPSAGADSSSLDSNKGIFSNTHKEYTELTRAMAKLNKNIPSLIKYFDER